MSYAIKGGEDWNLVITVPEQRDPCRWDQWSSQSLEIMRSYYKGWDPTLLEILKMVKRTSKWPVQDIQHLHSWSTPSKKMIMLGDAAHAMLPAMAAGAAIAIEDAYGLAQALRLIQSSRQLPDAIATWESVRVPRATAMQEASYRHMYTLHLADGPQQEARDGLMAAEVRGEHFVASPNQWSDPTTQRWAYLHDPAGEVRIAWEKAETEGEQGMDSRMNPHEVTAGGTVSRMISSRL